MDRALLIGCLVFIASYAAPAQDCGDNYNRASQSYRENKLDQANEYGLRAIACFRSAGKEDSLLLAYSQHALVVWTQKRLEDAVQLMDTAFLRMDRVPKGNVARIAALSRMGQLHTQLYELKKAAAYFERAEAEIRGTESPNRHYVHLYNHIAVMYLIEERYGEARQYAEKAYRLNRLLEGEDGADMTMIWQTLFFISRYSENFEQALADGKAFQQVTEKHYPPDHPNMGIVHNSLAIIYEALRQYDEALYHRQRAVDIQYRNFIQSENRFSLAAAYQNLGTLYNYMHEPFLSQAYLEKGSKLLLETYGEDGIGMVKVWVDLAVIKLKIGQYDEAEQLFDRAYALQKRRAPDDVLGLAYVETFFGDLYLKQERFNEAGLLYRTAWQRYRKAKVADTELALLTKQNLAQVLNESGQFEEALAMQREVLAAIRILYPKGNDAVAQVLHRLCETYLKAHRPVDALELSDDVFAELVGVDELPDRVGSWFQRLPFSYNTLVYIQQRMEVLTQLFNQSGQTKRLEMLLILADHYSAFVSENLHAFRTQAALIDLADVNKRIYSYAMQACWEMSRHGKDEAFNIRGFGYAERSKALLLRLAANNMLVDASSMAKEASTQRDRVFRSRITALNQQYLNSARNDSLLTLLSAETERYRVFQDSLRSAGDQLIMRRTELAPPTLDDIRARLLTGGETLLEYAATDQSVFIYVLTPESFHVHRVERSVLADVASLRMLHRVEAQDFVGPAYRLYEALIQPVAAYFSTDRLLIIPDADLYYLNFEILITHGGQKSFADMPYLIRKYDISYLLSAASALQLKAAYRAQHKFKALLFAPVFTDEMKANYRKSLTGQTFENEDYFFLYRQPFALRAAQRIGQLFQHDLFAEQEAQENTFKRLAPQYHVLHLGTHAEVNNLAPLESRLFFAKSMSDDGIDADDGYLYTYEIYAMQLRAELAVLTACETGAGAWRNGEGVVSLAHSFMYAGCPSVVMSLWKIDEQSSTDIITVFYENLKNGESKSTALRNAKLKLMHQHAGRLSHPYYWAGLALIGDAEPLYKSYAWLYWSLGLLVVGVAGTVFIKRRKQQKAA